ncbi:MAG: hypothetical protein GWM90_12175, partial [Gemmatimonadetes bacterium]|nr:hypothetical protein [Gemmatimonadota bacterium]NIQ54763.1 hypothetical protein [Gemmatimonadota bacterium]NIU74972.1 hypothetical protein [Gammaproteobacteria bacterium]NIX44845.1 hypothetical protein [Gemmatimonadota bacterium]NIY09083.1 hypothetical protein [Gemmatimonadota bacterium]
MRRILPLLVAPALALGGCDDAADPSTILAPDAAAARVEAGHDPAATAHFSVTITNLTESGQPVTPPLAVVHRRPLSLFSVGEAASFGLKEIAENGNLGPMHERLAGEHQVADLLIAAGDPPPLMPGASITFDLSTERGAKYLSFVSMLICTNDGFTALDGLRLPKAVGESVSAYTNAYDAGTEMNTEDFADLVPPCPVLSGVESDDDGSGMSDPALAENGVVHPHAGIQGIADL